MNQTAWAELMSIFGFGANIDTFQQLQTRYSEKHRKYHNSRHIDNVLGELDTVRDLTANYPSVALALWFHDAVYEIFSSTNEEDSAAWAVSFLKDNKAEQTLIDQVYSLIMATKHNHQPADSDEQLIVDIDLSILGTPAEEYQEFETNIRQEYKLVPGFVYRRKRIEILNGFVARDRIYSHDYFYNHLEQTARSNIAAAVLKLQNR